jgi:branched-subunit amino acid ABC-type transport system permease component
VLNGLAVGCIYGLVALGLVLIYKATELVNFAQGDLMMLGAFTCYIRRLVSRRLLASVRARNRDSLAVRLRS